MTDGPQVYGFPPLDVLPGLRWLGPDYVGMLVRDLTLGLRRQDTGTRVLGIRCEGGPTVQDGGGPGRAHDAAFPLQVYVRDGAGRSWRLSGRWTYVGRDIGGPAPVITHYWRLISAQEVN
ncbi:hypothetical protein DPM19_28945 [Actinomadura craniellae]|uniref:Uncharacterized protein n=1 Tax=Actinomadura craniellae TaxID=2231787 RepID=A0A365GXU0_9ACTN|nr:hypothetical protein [Actinomadura craniellae]RAY11655.1 hypothetical protein DPM19_28945 [Actinomadura craniellae]